MPEPILLGYNLESVFAEKLESVVKFGLVNTRMKDFYDLWTMIKYHNIEMNKLKKAVHEVFSNRGTTVEYPSSFEAEFYEDSETQKRWKNFLLLIGKEPLPFKDIIADLSEFTKMCF